MLSHISERWVGKGTPSESPVHSQFNDDVKSIEMNCNGRSMLALIV